MPLKILNITSPHRPNCVPYTDSTYQQFSSSFDNDLVSSKLEANVIIRIHCRRRSGCFFPKETLISFMLRND